MLIRSEEIYNKARSIVRRCGTRDALRIAKDLGIYITYVDDLDRLLGMYTYRYKERHILLNSKMDEMLMQLVCAHEIGHDILHRDLAKNNQTLTEFTIFDMQTRQEYESNAFAAHILIDDDEMNEYMQEGYDVSQLAAAFHTNYNLMLVKLNEMNRLGGHYNLPYTPNSDFLKNIKPEG